MWSTINKEGKRVLFRFLNVEKVRSIVVPNDIDELGEYAFSNKDALNLEAIYIPDHIVDIPAHCFAGNKATYIRLSPKTEHIGDGAFYNCQNLWKATVPPDCKLGTKRWDGTWANSASVFENCPKRAMSFSPWIYGSREKGFVTIMFEANTDAVLQCKSTDKDWIDLPFYRPNLFVADDSGEKKFYRVVEPNTNPTPRNPGKWIQRTKTICL